GLILVVAVVSRFYDLGLRVMSHDESLHTYFSWLLSRGGQFEHTPLMHGPLQFHMIALSYFIFGASDFTARIPAVLANIATIAFMWNYRKYLGKIGALIAAFLLLISPFMLYYARYVRNESLVALFGVVTIWAILRYLDKGDVRYFYWITAATALHFTTKETSFIYTAQALLFLLGLLLFRIYNRPWRNQNDRKTFGYLLAGALVVVLLAGAASQYGGQDTTQGGTETISPIVPGEQPSIEEMPSAPPPYVVYALTAFGGLMALSAVVTLFRGQPQKEVESNLAQPMLLSTLALGFLSTLVGLLGWAEHDNQILSNYFDGRVPADTIAGRIGEGLVAPTFYLPIAVVLLGIGMMAAGYFITKNILAMLPVLKQIRSFDLIMLLGTLVLPHLSALPINLIGWEMGDYTGLQAAQFIQIAMILIPVSMLSVGIGYGWKGKAWFKQVAVFYGIFALFYTTVFTHGAGFFSGMVSSLGYWLVQQGVERGSQPEYYYALVQIPVYEYLAAIASLFVAVIGIRWWWRSKPNTVARNSDAVIVSDHEVIEMTHAESRRIALYLLAYWVATSFAAYSIAGEKMPWLTVHIALPMLLLAGWLIGRTIQKIDWSAFKEQRGILVILLLPVVIASLIAANGSLLGTTRPFSGSDLTQLKVTSTFLFNIIVIVTSGLGLRALAKDWEYSQISSTVILSLFGLLGILTVKTSFAATYINYDRATEYLVYAHAARPVKDVMEQIEDISTRLTGDLSLEVGYDDDVTWPFSWYLRDYKNARIINDFGPEVRNIPVLVIGNDHWGEIDPILERNYYQFQYIRMWWPNQDYFNLTQERITNYITDPGLRNGIAQIWLDRDYTAYGIANGNANSLTLENWSPADEMRLYIRKDIVAQIWDFGVSPIPDPYEENVLTLAPERLLGAQGAGPLEFNAPRDVAVAPDGSIYVADTFNHRIQHISLNGELINEWGLHSYVVTDDPPTQITFNEPWGIAVSPDGEFVYVADTWNNRVQKFSAAGEYITEWGEFAQGLTDFGFWGPRDVAVDGDGNVYVSDTGNKRVGVYTADGEFISSIGGFGLDLGQFDEPVGLAIDRDNGLLYVADTWNQRVQVIQINGNGTFQAIKAWDIAGWDGQAIENKPYIAVANGQVFITDPEIGRVIVFDTDGNYLKSWTVFNPELGSGLINGIAVDAKGGVWVVDGHNHVLYYYILPRS
ncbi:MAG: TIGR03663 family protein, partial [Chloroflexota bacterium]